MSTATAHGLRMMGVVLFLISSPGCQETAISAATREQAPREVIYRVNSYRVPCVGVAPMQCLQIQRGDQATGTWHFFYSRIRGFEFEPGHLYRLRVLETPLPAEQVPADASSIRYDLIEVLEKSPDPRLAIHDIWALEAIAGVPISDLASDLSAERPYVEFNITRQEYLGVSGCASFGGRILALDDQRLRLGPATHDRTDRDCPEADLSARWLQSLEEATEWRREGRWLELADAGGQTLLRFRKTD